MRITVLGAIGAIGLLAGCASLSEDECRAGDWREIGQRDGQQGRTADRFADHVEACGEYGVRPDRALWDRGRQQGLTAYCTADNAFREGRSGNSLSPVCPSAELASLRRANERGLALHRLEQEIDSLRDDLRDIEDEIAEAEDADARDRLSLRLRSVNSRLRLLQAQRLTADLS